MKETKVEKILEDINSYIQQHFEEQKLKIAVEHSDEIITDIKLLHVSVDFAHVEYEHVDKYRIPPRELLYFFKVFCEEGEHADIRLISFYLNDNDENTRYLAYYGAMLDFDSDGEIDGISEENAEFDDEEKFVYAFLENIKIMDFIKENNFDKTIQEDLEKLI